MRRSLISITIAITTGSYMTNNETIKLIISHQEEKCMVTECAVNMCLIDVATWGVDQWVKWSPVLIADIFRNTAEEVLEDVMNEVESQSMGESIIDELLTCNQAERIDYKKALIGMKSGAIRYFDALSLYMEIHEEVKQKYYLYG